MQSTETHLVAESQTSSSAGFAAGTDTADAAPPLAPRDRLWVEHHAAGMLVGALLFVVCYFGAAAAVLAR